jgi:hypothetical protein
MPDKRQPTAYIVLYLGHTIDTDGDFRTDWWTWTVGARSAKEARDLTAQYRSSSNLDEEGVYVAVPLRSWLPHVRTVATRAVSEERPLDTDLTHPKPPPAA